MPNSKEAPKTQTVRVCLTGGGTAGHVTPHFALLKGIKDRGWDVFYVGSKGLEKPLVEAQGIPFYTIAAGKLRRYLSVENIVDAFRIGLGVLQATKLLAQKKPDVVFSKGGFVAVPVAVAAWFLKIPVVSHESDLTPGLANRLIAPFAKKILFTFPETKKYLPPSSVRVGTPIRAELLRGNAKDGLALCGFSPDDPLPTILVMGGSQGAQRVNEALLAILPWLLEKARVIHLTGKGKQLSFRHPRYKSFEFVNTELSDLYALSDFVISRAGANSIFEILAVKKPMLLIPLEIASRGDQVLNAMSFAKAGWATVLREQNLDSESLKKAIDHLLTTGDQIRSAQKSYDAGNTPDEILSILSTAATRSKDL